MQSNLERNYAVIIAGAGLSGMTLAQKLIERDYAGQVLILDKRTDFSRDQRWCVWGPVEAKLEPLVTTRWTNWQVYSSRGDQRRFSTPATPYTEFQAEQYFSHVVSMVSERNNFELKLGLDVTELIDEGDQVRVATSSGDFWAKLVVDARNETTLAATTVDSNEHWLVQSFVGWTVKAEMPCFEPDCVTLMDFNTPADDQNYGEFFYVLPYSENLALVECTVVGPNILPLETYRKHLEWYLERKSIRNSVTLSEEIGAIPMTSQRLVNNSSKLIHRLGTAAGAVKPSTGYGFARIQDQAERLAGLICGEKFDQNAGHKFDRRGFVDSIFLSVLAQSPQRLEELMMRMFRRVSADVTVKFLSERSSIADDLRVMGAVGDLGFTRPAIQRVGKLIGRY